MLDSNIWIFYIPNDYWRISSGAMSSCGDHRQKLSMAGCSPMRSWPGWRRVSMAFERQQSAAASLTLSCPGLSAPGLSDATGQYRLLSGLRLVSEPIRNRTCHRGTEPDTTHTQKQPPSTPYWASDGASWGQGQRPGWPLISRHVWTRPRTKRGPRQLIIICGVMKEGKRAPDCCMQLFQCGFSVFCWHGDLVSGCRTTGSSPKNSLPSPRCAALVPGLFVGDQEGGITPGMIPYYWACLPFRLALLLLAGSGLILLPVLPPLSWSLWCPHTLTTTSQQFTLCPFKSWRHCVGFGAKVRCNTVDDTAAL